MSKAYLSLGSNMGDRVANLKTAANRLNQTESIQVVNKSSFYTTAPVGYLNQDDFVNVVIEIETELEPMALLSVCQAIEIELKRIRLIHWGPRTIDVDILWIENFKSELQVLTVPHIRMLERAFVMVPLSELNPSLLIDQQMVIEWCSHLADQEVRKMTHEKW